MDDWTVGTLHDGIRSTGHGHLVTFELTGVLHSIDATVPADWADPTDRIVLFDDMLPENMNGCAFYDLTPLALFPRPATISLLTMVTSMVLRQRQ